MAIVRLLVGLLIAQTIAYVVISLWSRSVRRRKLLAEWDEDHPDAQTEVAEAAEALEAEREAFVEEGLVDYDGSLRRKLILLVYIIPFTLIGIIVYLVNYS